MGKFFNERIKNMPNSEVRKLKKSVKVTENPVFGQTKGWAEESRKDYIGEPSTPITEPVVAPPVEEDHLYVSDKDKRKLAEEQAQEIVNRTVNPDKVRQTRQNYRKRDKVPTVRVDG